ncbi:MAG: hypothetical protein OXU20_03775 [Myxococcales bacterium]|nr:hypothetical protein [Myxococcales bacterium]MDD9966379.1 hypothetical protein [Myxococcales bacterium]
MNLGSSFLQRLPGRDVPSVPIDVEPIGAAHIACWERLVRPSIAHSRRIDRDWCWATIVDALVTDSRGAFERTGWAVCAGPQANRMPVALVVCFEGFPYALDTGKQSVLVAFLAAAPLSCLERELPAEHVPRRAGRAALDVALTRSLARGLEGRTCASALAGAPSNLTRWYLRQGMSPVPAELDPRSVSPLFQRTTQLFHHDAESAEKAIKDLRHLRGPRLLA